MIVTVQHRFSYTFPMTLNDVLSEQVLGCAYRVSNGLGPGFVERVYENALAHELCKAGVPFERQKGIEVWYDGVMVGQFVCDFVVNGRLLVELKAVKALDELHMAQGLNYLRSTSMEACLLLNFGTPKLEVRRLVRGRSWKPVQAADEPVIDGDER